jgi:hypothetical protein
MKLMLNGMECMSENTLIYIWKCHKKTSYIFLCSHECVYYDTMKFHISNKTVHNLFMIWGSGVHITGGCVKGKKEELW